MATATSVIARFTGMASYSDGTHKTWGTTIDINGIDSPTDSSTTAKDAPRNIFAQFATLFNSTFTKATGDNYTKTVGSPTTAKTVNDWNMLISGRVTYSDGTYGDFGAEYTSVGGAGAFSLDSSSSTNFHAVNAVAGLKTNLNTIFKDWFTAFSVA